MDDVECADIPPFDFEKYFAENFLPELPPVIEINLPECAVIEIPIYTETEIAEHEARIVAGYKELWRGVKIFHRK